jgi:hypothetical protein
MKLTSHFSLVLSLRMCAVVPSLSHASSWHAASFINTHTLTGNVVYTVMFWYSEHNVFQLHTHCTLLNTWANDSYYIRSKWDSYNTNVIWFHASTRECSFLFSFVHLTLQQFYVTVKWFPKLWTMWLFIEAIHIYHVCYIKQCMWLNDI